MDMSGDPAAKLKEFDEELGYWQFFYNWRRPH
jgi:transposase InsO family protein